MLWIKSLNCHKIGFYISSLVFVLGLFFSVFFATDSFALTDVDTSSQSYTYVCGSNTGIVCSDYSFLHFKFSSLDPDNVTHYFIVYSNSDQVGRLNIIAQNYFLLGLDYYFPIPSSSSTYSFEATGNLQATVSYELVSSLSSGPAPSGTLNITQNGTYDVSSYASAEVDVPPVMGDYHDDFQQGITAIYVLGGVMLVIYFFYCIYRMFFRSLGESK